MSVADTMVAVIEDDPGIRDLVTDLLRREGFEVLAYADAASFFRSAPVERLDCLILDVMLPGEDGLSICRTLRAAHALELPAGSLARLGIRPGHRLDHPLFARAPRAD